MEKKVIKEYHPWFLFPDSYSNIHQILITEEHVKYVNICLYVKDNNNLLQTSPLNSVVATTRVDRTKKHGGENKIQQPLPPPSPQQQ